MARKEKKPVAKKNIVYLVKLKITGGGYPPEDVMVRVHEDALKPGMQVVGIVAKTD